MGERGLPWYRRSDAGASYAAAGLRRDCTIRGLTRRRWVRGNSIGALVTSARSGLLHKRGGFDVKCISQFADRGTARHTPSLEANNGGPRYVRRGGQVRLSEHLNDPQPFELWCRVKSLRARHPRGSVLDVSRNCPACVR